MQIPKAVFPACPRPVPIGVIPPSPAAELARQLDSLDVTHHWLPGPTVCDWRTGNPIKPTPDGSSHTHCSQFAAAAAERLGVYLLRPPEHSPTHLAAAQEDWLGSPAGVDSGWQQILLPGQRVATYDRAAEQADEGKLVVAVYSDPDPDHAGHIAVLRPSDWSPARIAEHGPEIIQAGATNYQSTDLETGFIHHPDSFAQGKIAFFAHSLASPDGAVGNLLHTD
jgi:hypothetical protein